MAHLVYMRNAGRPGNLKSYARLQLVTGKRSLRGSRKGRCTKTNSLCSEWLQKMKPVPRLKTVTRVVIHGYTYMVTDYLFRHFHAVFKHFVNTCYNIFQMCFGKSLLKGNGLFDIVAQF